MHASEVKALDRDFRHVLAKIAALDDDMVCRIDRLQTTVDYLQDHVNLLAKADISRVPSK